MPPKCPQRNWPLVAFGVHSRLYKTLKKAVAIRVFTTYDHCCLAVLAEREGVEPSVRY